MRVDGYVRVSKVAGRGGESFISPVDQREAIERLCRDRGWKLCKVFEELDESGARADRPKLLQAIERSEAGATNGVIVAKLDRFFRSQLHGLQAIERLRDVGAFFASADGDVDTRDERSQLMLGIRLAIAQDERDRRKRDFDSGRKRAIDRGIHPCPFAPFGYRKREDRRLEPDPVNGPIAAQIFERRAAGESCAVIAAWLMETGALTSHGNPKWTSRALREMLSKRVYLGEASSGEYSKADAHEALVDQMTWHRAQTATVVTAARSETRPALLAGLLRCAGCRRVLAPDHGAKDGGLRYRCQCNYPAGRCPEPAFTGRGDVIDEIVVRRFFESIGQMAAEPAAASVKIRAAEAQLRTAEHALATFRDDPRIIEALGAGGFADGLAKRKADVDRAMDDLAAARDVASPIALDRVELEELWPKLSVYEQRKLLSLAIDAVFLRRRGRSWRSGPSVESAVHICFRGDGPELPGRGRNAKMLTPFRFPIVAVDDAPGDLGVAAA